MKSERARLVANAVLFQLAWFACVQGDDVVAMVTVAAVLALHQHWVMRDAREWYLLPIAALLGLAVDTLWIRLGVLVPAAPTQWAPLWLVSLWLLLATTLLHSLHWLAPRPLLSALLGAVAGPLAYYAGTAFGAARLGGVEPVSQTLALAILALGWGMFMPLLFWLARVLVANPVRVSA